MVDSWTWMKDSTFWQAQPAESIILLHIEFHLIQRVRSMFICCKSFNRVVSVYGSSYQVMMTMTYELEATS